MIRQIVRSEMLLKARAAEANEADANIARDLLDTLRANAGSCAGMAANMIGAPKRIIAFFDDEVPRVMFNPEITAASGEFEAEEGCLSLEGVREAKRHREIAVRYQDERFNWHEERFEGWTAQVIEHEIDHTNGIVI